MMRKDKRSSMQWIQSTRMGATCLLVLILGRVRHITSTAFCHSMLRVLQLLLHFPWLNGMLHQRSVEQWRIGEQARHPTSALSPIIRRNTPWHDTNACDRFSILLLARDRAVQGHVVEHVAHTVIRRINTRHTLTSPRHFRLHPRHLIHRQHLHRLRHMSKDSFKRSAKARPR